MIGAQKDQALDGNLKMIRRTKLSTRWLLSGASLACLLAVSGFGHAHTESFRFPSGFLWGAATAAHQIEGNNTHSDWWEWEQQCHLANCEKSGLADDGYHRYPEDLKLAQDLGFNAYRMSVEWARIEPEQGVYDPAEIEHYRDVLRTVHARGMKVVLTLQHFSLPSWVAHHAPQGANSWLDPDIVDFFADYTDHVVQALGDQVDYWLTINEPTVSMLTAYIVGVSPPGIQDFKKAPVVLANFLKAHARAYHIIHSYYPNAMVSFAHHARIFDPYNPWSPLDQLLAGFISDFWNHQFITSIRDGKIHFHVPFVADYSEDYPGIQGTLDYLGINYYTRDRIQFDSSSPEMFSIQPPDASAPRNDVGWELYPEGFYRVLKDFAQYKLPILITENGTADARDAFRSKFLCDHLAEVERAMKEGIPVFGYLHWSLYDNFEWSSGFGPRFGLVGIDYDHDLERQPRPSAALYSRIIRDESLDACQSLGSQ
jgi:beta-glucosidase